MHGGGLGYGRMDAAGGRLFLSSEGKITASFGFEECGQGILAAIEQIVMEELGCAAEDISIVIGDTAKVPKSGFLHSIPRHKHGVARDPAFEEAVSSSVEKTGGRMERLFSGKSYSRRCRLA